MSASIAALTLVLWLIPVGIAALGFMRYPPLLGLALFFVAIYATVWFWFRPQRFVITPTELIVEWPWRTEHLARRSILRVESLTPVALKAHIGRGVRIGAGGLWGGFGLLKTTREGTLRFYISRLDGYVWIGRGSERAWLITPEHPEAFVAAMTDPPLR
jgi:hypothetical protein